MIEVVIGPTASGKSSLAVGRALKGSGVIINADAMQCYAGLPILTAQPDEDERQGVPHCLYGVLAAHERMSAADWVRMATGEVEAVLRQGKTPYLVGGTGLYIKALMEGLSPMPDIPAAIRAGVRARAANGGLGGVYADLARRDPFMAARLKPGDTQRVLRAMEVLEATGASLASWQAAPALKPPAHWRFHVVALNPPRAELEEKIRARLYAMIDRGVLAEVEALDKRIEAGEVPNDAPMLVAHGFRHFRAHLKGRLTLEEAIGQTAIETRQYAKRQRTWLRHQIRADETIG